MRTGIIAWAVGFSVLVLLYTVGTVLWFNHAAPAILGLPPLIFWFVLLPLVSPVLIGIVYLIDRAAGGIGTGVEDKR